MIKSIYISKIFFLICIYIFISGCASSNNITAHIDWSSVKYLNPSEDGKTSPVSVSIFALSRPMSFKAASYRSLALNSINTLGTNLLDKEEIEIKPGEKRKTIWSLPLNTCYLGFVAEYKNINTNTWKSIITIRNNDSLLKKGDVFVNLLVSLNMQSMKVKVIREGRSWW